jgi:ABC-2 type transport system ATP-binding protein
MNAIEMQELRRIYRARIGVFGRKVKEVLAVDGIDFNVAQGELFGLLGPNGAGKTTTVKMLTTLLTPTSGQARVLGYDLVREADQIRHHIGFVFGGERGLYWRLSAYDNMTYFANLYHVPPEVQKRRIPYLLDLVGLAGRGDEKIEGYSRGMKQRLHIARALLHDPELLFLDEPTIGLDPVGARELRSTIRVLQSERKTILLTTHYMFEADALCQRIAVINQGKIVALDTPTELKYYVRDLSVVEVEVFGIPPNAVERVRALDGVDMVSIENRGQRQALLVQSGNGAAVVAPVVSTLEGLGLRVGAVVVREPTLEDAYVRLVGGDS